MEAVLLVIGLIVGAALGFLIAQARNRAKGSESLDNETMTGPDWQQKAAELDKHNAQLAAEKDGLHTQMVSANIQLEQKDQDIRKLTSEVSEWRANYYNLEEKLAGQKEEMETLQKKFTTEFENIANRILETKSAKFTEQNKENLDTVLKPLQEKIKDFGEKMERNYSEEVKERVTLKTEIKHLVELNQQLSDDANNLASALKGESKTQGDWGEWQLEMLLENAGLEKGRHYTTQSSFRDDQGNLKRPDVIILLPENKHLVIDSKVSLTAYNEYFQADTDEERALHLKAHLASVRNHIRDLRDKEYHKLYDINVPDYVLMFVPLEPAFTLALRHDASLFEESLKRNIVIVTSSTLLATMRTVTYIWKQEDQKEHIQEIIRQSEALYDKFVLFVDELLKVGKQLEGAKGAYDTAMGRLSSGNGNLVRRVESIRKMGLAPKKELPSSLVERSSSDFEALPNSEEESKA